MHRHELPPETAEADARLADDRERLANDIDAWLAEYGNGEGEWQDVPPDFSVKFDGRLFRCLEGLVVRKPVTGSLDLLHAQFASRHMREWSHRLRRR